jgi:enoyl-CoA hydratase/carnithine racemase
MMLKSELIELTERIIRADGNKIFSIGVIRFKALNGNFPWGTPKMEHRFNQRFISDLECYIDQVEREKKIHAIIFTGSGKYFTNGMDVEFIKSHFSEADALQKQAELLMSRILKLPMLTISLINGHCTAAGAIFSLCTDYRIMNKRGLFFTPAVDLGIVYSQGMIEIAKEKIRDPNILRDALLFSKRFSSEQLLEHKIISSIVGSMEEGMTECERLVALHAAASPESLGEVRTRMYLKAIEHLSSPTVSPMWWDRLSGANNPSKL